MSPRSVIPSIFWIVGLAILLAIWSMSYYRAQITQRKILEVFEEPNNKILIAVGMVLTFVGFGITDSRLWATIIWYLLAALSITHLIYRRRQSSAKRRGSDG